MTAKENSQSGYAFVKRLLADEKMAGDRIGFGQHCAGWLNAHARPFLRGLGKLEALTFEETLEEFAIEKPVYVCGLARAGTTILLELLHDTRQFATHSYRDYPFIDVPVLWNRWQKLAGGARGDETPRERAHHDGIVITLDSPEAFEEMVWMDFFPGAHDPAHSHVLTGKDSHPAFEKYYQTHIRKIMFTRRAGRYLAKGNYNLTRIAYLAQLFPDARFVIPLRDPSSHIASLMKQHDLLCALEERDPRAVDYMKWAGHYEFGHARQPIHCGDEQAVRRVQAYWQKGEELAGWALYWAMLHEWLAETLAADPALAAQVKIVDYQALCEQPEPQLRAVFDHCDVSVDDTSFKVLAGRLKAPIYYRPAFSDEETAQIEKVTGAVYQKLLARA